MKSPVQKEAQRLAAYYPFDESVLETVSTVASIHRETTWQGVYSKLPDPHIFSPKDGKPVEVLDIAPMRGYDQTYVYHLPMGNGIDPNIMTRLAVLSKVLPTTRIIAAGNPTHPFKSTGRIAARDLLPVWRGNLRGAIGPTLEYVADQGIGEVSHIGYSYGADKAAGAAQYSGAYDQRVRCGVFMEPAGIAARGLVGMTKAFGASAAALPGYVAAANSPALNEARQLAEQESHGQLGFAGLLRASNLAIAHMLGNDGFTSRVTDALNIQAEMSAVVVWGTESEIALHNTMQQHSLELLRQFPDRVGGIVLEGQKHAMGDDIFLHAALVAQSTRHIR